jgi:hypothetical protein
MLVSKNKTILPNLQRLKITMNLSTNGQPKDNISTLDMVSMVNAKFQFTSFLEIVHKPMITFSLITYFNYFISSIYMTIYDYYESSKS